MTRYPTPITDFCEISKAYYAIQYPNKKQFGETYLESHIFDEEKSVRWNREEAQRRNMDVATKLRAAREEYDRQIEEFWKNVDKYIANEFGISLEGANAIRESAWTGNTVAYEIETFETFLEDMFDCIVKVGGLKE